MTAGSSLRPRGASGKHRVNLINPPSAPGTTANREGAAGLGVVYPHPGAFLYPPHTLAVVASNLRSSGYHVQVFDAAVSSLSANMEVDVNGVFVSYASLDADLEFITALREKVSAKLIAFGPAMRFVGREVLDRAPVDAVLVGEAEGFFLQALRHLEQTGPTGPQMLTPEVVRVSNYDAQGFIQDLDVLPFPAWDLLQLDKYGLLTVLSSRGCPDGCAYCPYAAAQGHRFRARSVNNVLDELAWLSERYHPSRVVFRDPVFALENKRVVELCTGILRRGLKLHWECESRPEHFDRDLLRLMRRAGCQWVKIGLETTDETLLWKLRRVASREDAQAYLEKAADVVRACKETGLRCRLFVMAGLPGQDVSMAQQTRRFVENLRPAALNIKLCEPYPGTDLHSPAGGDHESQMATLCQAQRALQAHDFALSPLARGRRWLKRVIGGELDA